MGPAGQPPWGVTVMRPAGLGAGTACTPLWAAWRWGGPGFLIPALSPVPGTLGRALGSEPQCPGL